VDLSRFSPRQCTAITAAEGPLSILAGPGSGKTTTLAGRIAYLVSERAVPPTSILAITFTTSAAGALRRRLETVQGSAALRVDIRTFHSFGLRVIRSWSEELGFGQLPPAVYGRDDARAVLREAASELGLAVRRACGCGRRDPWAASLAQLDRAVERYRLQTAGAAGEPSDSDVLDGAFVAELSAAYERRLEARAAVDYPAMLTLPLRLLDANQQALHMLQDAYRWVLVDEYQDCCQLQAGLLQRLTARHQNLAVVGDPWQSIYGFRGADPRLLSEFPRTFPGAQVVVLERNHRSTRTIVALANALAAPLGVRPASWTTNPNGPQARLYVADDDIEEAHFVAGELVRLLAAGELAQPGQAAVLFRTNAQAQAFALALRARGIPVRLRTEADLFACPEVRDLVAYLRLAHSPHDQPSLARILNTPPRRLRAVELAFRRQPVPIDELAEWAHRRAGSAARGAVERLLAVLDDIHAASCSSRPSDALEVVLDRTGYATWLASSERGRGHLEHVQALRGLLAASEAPELATWLADLQLDEAEAAAADDRAVPLLTIHASKGREWPVVFIAGWEEGLLPLSHAASGQKLPIDDEERRLAYVALSRSQVQVYLTWCRSRWRGAEGQDRHRQLRQPSRYLRGLPAHLIVPTARPPDYSHKESS
jgi:DNA helicase II / ATP-dependent DNA helicase PcrA